MFELTFLGTGSSMGIPVIGCQCEVCHSTNPYNQRLRSSALLKVDGRTLLIDASPDFRTQALKYNIENVDGVILTHMHFDHIAGLDDLRVFNYRFQTVLPLLMHIESFKIFEKRFDYLLQKPEPGITQIAKFDIEQVSGDRGDVEFLDLPIRYFSYSQARMHVMGFRIRNLAYVTDIKEYDSSLFEELKGLDVLVLSALRLDQSKVHLNIEEAVQFASTVGAKKCYLVHMAHEIDHAKVSEMLPDHMELAYDGLKI